MGRAESTRDVVQIHITENLPIQSKPLPFADRIEIRFGRAFPVTLIVDRPALDRLSEVIRAGLYDLEAAGGGDVRRDQR
jgi:hypothetical protein